MSHKHIEWIQCECHAHAIQVMRFDDEDLVYVSLWSHGFDQDHRPSLWQRLRYAWQMLWRGDFQTNEIILNPEESRDLSRVLIKMAAPKT
jgi:hypothetical protein